jgi:hypothetical protein
MNAVALTVLLCAAGPAQARQPDNLDLSAGTLAGWHGRGFYLTTANPRGPSTSLGVCSSDAGAPGRKGSLRYTFVVPPGDGLLRCSAYAACRKGLAPDGRLDVLLLTEDSAVVGKKVQTARGWQPAQGLLPRLDGRAREYAWELAGLEGRRVQIVLLDHDGRRGCHLFCSGFRLSAADDQQERAFALQMKRLERDKDLAPMSRFESKHFLAWSNAEAGFTTSRLRNCEVIYQLFFDHFRKRGFTVQAPPAKLMVAVFDSQAGFEAYLGQRMPSAITGVYSRSANQLVVYDLSQNEALVAAKHKALLHSRSIGWDRDRARYLETMHRYVGEVSQDSSLSTAMHETAHQLSFNCGLLNRHGDVPVWLCEGLACYCEATEKGGWQGIGEANPGRVGVLAAALRQGGRFIPLQTLIEDDHWRDEGGTALLGYSQSWALFRMLMQQRPAALRAYLALIYPRRTPDHRLSDFGQVFGGDLARLEQHYHEYLRQLTRR